VLLNNVKLLRVELFRLSDHIFVTLFVTMFWHPASLAFLSFFPSNMLLN